MPIVCHVKKEEEEEEQEETVYREKIGKQKREGNWGGKYNYISQTCDIEEPLPPPLN